MFANKNTRITKNKGMALIEVMVSISLSLLLISFLLELYVINQKSTQIQFALNHVQDSGRIASDILKKEIRQAGNIGCAKLATNFPIISYKQYFFTPQTKISGTNTEIFIKHVSYPNAILVDNMKNPDTFYINSNVHFSKNTILLISTCKQAELFQVKRITYSNPIKIMTAFPLHHYYEKNAEVGRLESNHYFIEKTHRKNQDGTPIYSLFMEGINQPKTELVEGINHMKISYSIKRNGLVIDVSADEISNWDEVVGVAINFEVYSPPIKKNWYMYAALNGK